MAAKPDLGAMEKRRLEGVRLLKPKVSQLEFTKRLGVSRQTVNVWARRLDDGGGAEGRLWARARGRARRMDEQQRKALRSTLLMDTLAAGFAKERSTIKRVRAGDQAALWQRVLRGSMLATTAQPGLQATNAGGACRATQRRSR